MDNIKQQLIWPWIDGIKRSETVLERDGGNNTGASERLKKLRDELKEVLEKIESGLAAVECTVMPPAGALVYHVNPLKSVVNNYVNDNENFDPSGLMEYVLVKEPNFGYAIRFIADAPGPVLAIKQEDKSIVYEHNMIPDNKGQGPLYNAGDLLEYRGPMLGPGLKNITLDSINLNSPGSLVKIIKNDTRLPLPSGSYYAESATHYTILFPSWHCLPCIASDLEHDGVHPMDITLVPITGQVVSEEVLCHVKAWLPKQIREHPEKINNILQDEKSQYCDQYLTLSEMMIPVEPQVKSAAKKQ